MHPSGVSRQRRDCARNAGANLFPQPHALESRQAFVAAGNGVIPCKTCHLCALVPDEDASASREKCTLVFVMSSRQGGISAALQFEWFEKIERLNTKTFRLARTKLSTTDDNYAVDLGGFRGS